MSRHLDADPECKRGDGGIDLVIEGRPRDLGGLVVRRVLPSAMRRLVGPFIFFDHMGPVDFAPGEGIGVRPHPHIALATITYLLEGVFVHRDSLGSEQPIRPGDVNWMVAGRGVVHSERTSPEVKASGGRMHGIQTWVALPQKDEEIEPRFEHHPRSTIPIVNLPGAELHVIAGTAYGAKAPTGVLSPTLYVHARLEAGATLPVTDEHEERAVYVVDGSIECSGKTFTEGAMIVLRPGAEVSIRAIETTNVMLVGGAKIDGERHIFWNFVSSSKERLERAKADWREQRFPKIPGDDVEFIPLPE
ncbi:pirin family protein [Polyangium jinanense]|uniref:Pirin family protein n=1 Tax=Polyangium jinanense TaxID=2829994 RepID=A0A9X3XGN5_9BACT|nr:pirin family protein [Polyangium jinanense]MDC3962208.1 pirin family protein [Polyangium jinanense]MDC3988753.1 pirin family protein [Polyangium jinanense]